MNAASGTPETPARHDPEASPAVPTLLSALIVGAAFVATLALFWNGIGPRDAERYLAAALDWSENGPVLGDTHWALRHPYILPMAAAFSLFGRGEFAATLPNIAYSAGLAAITFVFTRRYLGAGAGLAAAFFVATSAFLTILPIELRVFGPEVFFAALACWFFVEGLETSAGRAARAFALAGLSIGGAWLCRENAAFLPIGLGLVALWRADSPLRALFWLGAGFGAIILAELVLYAVVAGDPLYRYIVDFGHAGAENVGDLVAPRGGVIAHLMKPFVNAFTYPVVTPFIILAALIWLAAGFRASLRERAGKNTLIVFAVTSLIGFLISSYGLRLNEPHYFPLVVYTALISLGAFAAHLFKTARPRLGAAFVGLVVLLNAAGADFRDYDEYAESRHLARVTQRAEESIVTDAITAVRTRMLLRLAGFRESEAATRIRSIVEDQGALCGSIYVATPRGAAPAIAPAADWREEWRAEVRKTRWTHELLRRMGLGRSASSRLREILAGAPPVALYRGPACGD